jgi:hypothetical protein
MDSECVISQELGNRISKLESQNRRLRRIGAATPVVLTLLVIMGEASSRRTVEANEFVLRDGNGNVRARLSMSESPSTPEMVLLDEKGRTQVNPRFRFLIAFNPSLRINQDNLRDVDRNDIDL